LLWCIEGDAWLDPAGSLGNAGRYCWQAGEEPKKKPAGADAGRRQSFTQEENWQ
jgi:hypothetical protein